MGDRGVRGSPISQAPVMSSDAALHHSISHPFRSRTALELVWVVLGPLPSVTDLLSELHPGAGDGLGAGHFTKQLHGLSCTHLLVLRKLDDLRGHGWGSTRERVSSEEEGASDILISFDAASHIGLLLLSHFPEPSG